MGCSGVESWCRNLGNVQCPMVATLPYGKMQLMLPRSFPSLCFQYYLLFFFVSHYSCFPLPPTPLSCQTSQFSRSVLSDSLRPHESQHRRPPCPSPTPGVYPKSCLLSRWCHPTISSSVVRFSSCPQSFPTSGSFQMSQLFASGGQNIGVSALPPVLPMNTQE